MLSNNETKTLSTNAQSTTLDITGKKLVSIILVNSDGVIRANETVPLAYLTTNDIGHTISFFGASTIHMNATVNLRKNNNNLTATLVSHNESGQVFLGVNIIVV